MLGSRLLSPHFGSGIDVWACLISTFLAAFSIGSIVGGSISNLAEASRRRAQFICALASIAGLAVTALWGKALLDRIEELFPAVLLGVPLSCLALFFVPVTALSTFSPQCVHYLAQRGTAPGKASGLVYGVSTFGNIAGVMLTIFVFIPQLGVSKLLNVWLVVAVVSLTALLNFLKPSSSSSS